MRTYVEPTSACNSFPIIIPIPIPGFGVVDVQIAVDIIGTPCATVQVLVGMESECPPEVTG